MLPDSLSEENFMRRLFRRFIRDDSGVTSIEYAVIASLISIGIVSAASTIGGTLQNTFTTVASNLK